MKSSEEIMQQEIQFRIQNNLWNGEMAKRVEQANKTRGERKTRILRYSIPVAVAALVLIVLVPFYTMRVVPLEFESKVSGSYLDAGFGADLEDNELDLMISFSESQTRSGL